MASLCAKQDARALDEVACKKRYSSIEREADMKTLGADKGRQKETV